MVDSSGAIRQIIEPGEEVPPDSDEEEENDRLARAIELSLTSPDVPNPQPFPAKATRVVRFNLPLLDPPVRVAPRLVPVIPRMRSVRFRPPPAPVTPKPRPPSPPSREQRMSATMRFFQSTGQRDVQPRFAPEDSSSSSAAPIRAPVSDSPNDRPEITPEPEPEPVESDAESFVFD